MMRCRPGIVQSYGRALLGGWGGPGSAAHRFAHSHPEWRRSTCMRSRCAASGTRSVSGANQCAGTGAAAAAAGRISIAATRFFTARCTFSKARTSIWRTRSRETPNSDARSSRVMGSSASRRASKMRRSRSLSTVSASPSALRRLLDSSLSASRVSWSEISSTSQSCHSPESPSSRVGALSDTSPPRRRFMSTTSCSVTPSRRAMILTWSGRRSLSSSAEILLFALRRLKNSFFWLAVVPIFTSDHERRMYSWMAALIHHVASFFGLEALERLHQADIPLRNDFGDGQAVAAISHSDLGHQVPMAGDEPVRGLAVAIAPTLGEHVLVLALQQGEPPDLLIITGEAGFDRKDHPARGTGHAQSV